MARSHSLSRSQSRAVSYLVTRIEYEHIVNWLKPHISLPVLLPTEAGNGASTHEDALGPTASRQSSRLFALIFSIALAYENILLGVLRRKKLSNILRTLQFSSSLRLASFVASFSALYRLVLARLRTRLPELAPSIQGKERQAISLTRLRRRILLSPALPPFLAALAASPTMLLEGKGQRSVTIAVYTLTRALHGAVVAAGNKGLLTQAMIEGRWWWGGHLVFALANGLLLHAFVYDPSTFPAAYSSFILRFSSAYLPSRPAQLPSSAPWPTPRDIVDAIAASSRARYPAFVSPLLHPSAAKPFASEALNKMKPILNETHPGHQRLTCAFLHPNETACQSVASSFITREFRSASKFFSALSLLGLLIRWKKFLKTPDESIYRALLSTITSSAFLSLSLGTSWSLICGLQHYLPGGFLSTRRFFVQGFLAALWVGLVGGQRATDLGLYAGRLAIQCAWDTAIKKGKVKNVPHGQVIVFGLSIATLMAFHDANPGAINSPFVRGALRRIGGPSAAQARLDQEAKEVKKRRGSTTTYGK